MNEKHVSFNANGVRIFFPFEPYAEQRDYCNHVIQAITKQQNAILESPTGTGKTLSLLTSSLAWQQNCNEPSRMIYYLSRTHLQLSQAAKEMKKTAYARVPSVVLASRTHMCLNDEVKGQSLGAEMSINRACQNAIAKNSCVYYNNYEEKLKARLDWNKVHDIEDLHAFGRANQCCPFYASKKIAETQAALIFMPYNYLLDLSVRKSVQLKLDKSVVIIDEGHNIESALKDSASAKFTMQLLKTLQDCCEKLPAKLNEAMMRDLHGLSRQGGYDPDKAKRGVPIVDEFKTKKSGSSGATDKKEKKENKVNPIEELAELLTNDKVQQVNKCARLLARCQDLLKTNKGRYVDTKCDIDSVIAALRQAGIEFSTSDAIITTLDSMATFWSIVGVVNARVVSGYMAAITNLSHFISLIYPPGTMSMSKFESHIANLKKHYSAYIIVDIERDTVLESSNKLINWTLNLWCLNPGIGLRRVIDDACVIGPRSIIITSGTLAPIDPISRDMEKEFKVVKEFNHLITKDQMQITIVNQSPKGYLLDTTYTKTENPLCQTAIGETLSSLLCALPFGTLVFFPSYRLMRIVLAHCENKPFWTSLKRVTNIFKEAKDQQTFSDDMSRYKKIVDSNGRAVFIGVCRGKLSEGTNLEKNHCRSVIIVGLPYPNRGDPQILETLAFQTRKGDLGGSTWYTNQMRRALGQAIGRVIRSKDDFGMVFLCDPRFTMYKMLVSKWIQDFYPNEKTSDYKKIASDIQDFFARHDIDISALSLASVAGASSTGAFELEAIRRKRPLSNTSDHGRSSNNIVSSSQRSTQEVIDEPVVVQKSFKDRQAEMLKSYTVDLNTYNKIRNLHLKDQNKPTSPKKPRTTLEVIDSLFTQPEVLPTVEGPLPEAPQPEVCADTTSEPDGTQQRKNDPRHEISESTSSKATKPAAKKPHNPMKKQPVSKSNRQVCYICKNEPVRPFTINCPCQRFGCQTCLKGLNNKPCGDCGETLKLKHFRPKLFNIFQKA